jgi:hypothetical protein
MNWYNRMYGDIGEVSYNYNRILMYHNMQWSPLFIVTCVGLWYTLKEVVTLLSKKELLCIK